MAQLHPGQWEELLRHPDRDVQWTWHLGGGSSWVLLMELLTPGICIANGVFVDTYN